LYGAALVIVFTAVLFGPCLLVQHWATALLGEDLFADMLIFAMNFSWCRIIVAGGWPVTQVIKPTASFCVNYYPQEENS
jgi:hypothetical protein